MSDFDNLFREKLDEEQTFPRRNKNWKMVSKRLDAFDAGGITHHSYLKYWKIAALAAAVTAGVLAWKVVKLKQENRRLEEIVQTSSLPAAPEHLPLKPEASNTESTALTLPSESTPSAPKTVNAEKEPQQEDLSPDTRTRNITNEQISATPGTKKPAPTSGQYKNENRVAQKQYQRRTSTPASPEARAQNKSPEIAQQNTTTPAKGQDSTPVQEKTKQQNTENRTTAPENNGQAITSGTDKPLTSQPAVPVLPTAIDSTATAQTPLKATVVDTAQTTIKDTVALQKEALLPPVAAQTDTLQAAKTLALEPPKAPKTYSRLQAGAQIFRGFPMPGEEGVSVLQGQGISAAWRVWNQFSLTTDANWLRFDINTTKFVPRFHPHHPGPGPHGGPGQDDQLVKVESTQRQRLLSLGLQYTVPLHFPVRPSVHIAHTWVHIDPQLITYTYEEQPHGPMHDPEIRYQAEKALAQDLNRIWRAGIGLQYDTHRWIFGIGADYMRDFASSDAMFNSVMVQAGLQYKIL